MKPGSSMNFHVLFGFAYFLESANVISGAGGSCPGGWTSLATGCYRFLPDSGYADTFEKAKSSCASEGGYLVEINSQEEQDALVQFSKDNGRNGDWWVWLGATDRSKEGEWIWIHSGQKMTFNAWHRGEPNNKGNYEDCLVAWHGFEWFDISCGHAYTGRKALCEYPACAGLSDQWSCCTKDKPCLEGQGDCDYDSDCQGSLVCDDHDNNCQDFNPSAEYAADCCKKLPCAGLKDQWSCCTKDKPCLEGQGDCDYDSDCQGSLVCDDHDNNCQDFNPNAESAADCCKKPPVNGGWSDWSAYDACSATCGPSTKTRERTCTEPVPSNGGSTCSGSNKETATCNFPDCGPYCPKGYKRREAGSETRKQSVLKDDWSDSNDLLSRTKPKMWCHFIAGCSVAAYYKVCCRELVPYCPNLDCDKQQYYLDTWKNKKNNKDISELCCFIIRSKSHGILIISDHAKQNAEFNQKCPSQDCAYKSYDTSTGNLGDEICLNDVGSDYTCCSTKDGALCENYNPTSNSLNTDYYCSNDCQEIANCKNDPDNEWCQKEKMADAMKEVQPTNQAKPKPPPKDCVAILEDEPVMQTAKYFPKALKHAYSGHKKRGLRDCPAWNHWRFNCYKAVFYMLYNEKKHWYYVYEKQSWRYFEHDCCSEFQSKCSKKPIYLKHEANAICPAYFG